MKKECLFIPIALIMISQVLAINTNLKQEYAPGETLIIEISGNFINNLQKENIQFYSGRLYLPLQYNLAKIQNNFYLYALLPNQEKNLTLIIKNAHYEELGKEKLENLNYNFSVKGNLTLFSVNPGFIVADKDFSLEVEGKLKQINLTAKFLNSTQEILVREDTKKEIYFSTQEIKNSTFTYIYLQSGETKYEIPALVFKSENLTEENKTIVNQLVFSKSRMNLTVFKKSDFRFKISLENNGDKYIENINFNKENFKDIISLNPEKINKLSPGEILNINLTINSGKEGIINRTIIAYSGNYSDKLEIFIETLEDEKDFKNKLNNTDAELLSCSELGKICADEEDCDSERTTTTEGICCLGNCKKKSSGSIGKTIIIILIILALALIGFFVYKRMKMKKKTSDEVLKEKSSSFEERFKSREVKSKLSRI